MGAGASSSPAPAAFGEMPRKPKDQTQLVELNTTPSAPKRVKHGELIAKTELYLARRLPRYRKALEELALGHKRSRITPDGEEEVYDVPPDAQALKYLIDRAMGKTPEKLEITGEGGGPLTIMPWRPKEEEPEPEPENVIDGEYVEKEE